jgi:hypothetical protein
MSVSFDDDRNVIMLDGYADYAARKNNETISGDNPRFSTNPRKFGAICGCYIRMCKINIVLT